MKSCEDCKFAKLLPFGNKPTLFCLKNPPTVEIQRTADSMTVSGWFPPTPTKPCGAFRRRWFGWLRYL